MTASVFDLIATGVCFVRGVPTDDGRQVDDLDRVGRGDEFPGNPVDIPVYRIPPEDDGVLSRPRIAGLITHTKWDGDDLFALVVMEASDMDVGSEFSLNLDVLMTADNMPVVEEGGLLHIKRAAVHGATINSIESSCWKGRAKMLVLSRMTVDASLDNG